MYRLRPNTTAAATAIPTASTGRSCSRGAGSGAIAAIATPMAMAPSSTAAAGAMDSPINAAMTAAIAPSADTIGVTMPIFP